MPTEEDEDFPQVERGTSSLDAVRQRVEDWLGRLGAFLKENEDWAVRHGWSAASAGDVEMHEELMRDFSFPPARQPILRLDGPDGA